MGQDDQIPAGSPPSEGGADAQPDDGFTAEERQQFNEMQTADAAPADQGAAPAADVPAGGTPGADGAAAAAAAAAATPDAGAAKPGAPAAGAAAEGADDDEGEDEAPAAGQPGADQRPPKRVAYGKFRRTEEARKTAESRATAAEDRLSRADERLKILTEALTSPAPKGGAQAGQQAEADDPMPDREKDVFEYLAWSDRRAARIEQQLEELRTGVQNDKAGDAVFTAYQTDTMQYRGQNPHFDDAYRHLMATRVIEHAAYFFGKDLTEAGVTLTPEEGERIKREVEAEERQLATGAIKNKKSPAAMIVSMARARGWAPRQAAAADPAAGANGAAPGAGAKPNASAKPPAANGAAKPNVKDEIEKIKNGQDAAMSLSAGGGSPANPLTAAKLADMPQDEFNALVDRLSPEEFRRVVEGTG